MFPFQIDIYLTNDARLSAQIKMVVLMFVYKKYCNASKLLPFSLTTIVTLAFWLFLETSYDERWYYKPVADCNFSSDVEQETIVIAEKIQQILQRNHVTFFLCRGSLWGVLRLQKLQPWDKDLDICVLYGDWSLIDASYMYRQFRWEQLGLSYNGRLGLYEIRYGQGKANLIFYDWLDGTKEWLQRIGWENWIFQKWQNRKIPAKLIKTPLPHVKLYRLRLPVPHSGIDLQKYLYPNDWWKDIKPPGC